MFAAVDRPKITFSNVSEPLQLDLYSEDGETRAKHVRDYAHAIDVAVVTAYAEALAGAANYYNTNSCWAWADTSSCIYPDGPCASCTASAVGDTYISEIDAIATAGVPPHPLCSSCCCSLGPIHYKLSMWKTMYVMSLCRIQYFAHWLLCWL